MLIVAFALGTLIGAEWQRRRRDAGWRPDVLVAPGAASFVHPGVELNGHAGAPQVGTHGVSGVDFLGASVIMREGGEVRGRRAKKDGRRAAIRAILRGWAPLAQLDRVSGFEPEGRRFESCGARHPHMHCQ